MLRRLHTNENITRGAIRSYIFRFPGTEAVLPGRCNMFCSLETCHGHIGWQVPYFRDMPVRAAGTAFSQDCILPRPVL